MISSCLHSDPRLNEEAAVALDQMVSLRSKQGRVLEEMVLAAFDQMRKPVLLPGTLEDRGQNSSHSNFLALLKNISYWTCAKTVPCARMPMSAV